MVRLLPALRLLQHCARANLRYLRSLRQGSLLRLRDLLSRSLEDVLAALLHGLTLCFLSVGLLRFLHVRRELLGKPVLKLLKAGGTSDILAFLSPPVCRTSTHCLLLSYANVTLGTCAGAVARCPAVTRRDARLTRSRQPSSIPFTVRSPCCKPRCIVAIEERNNKRRDGSHRE